MPAKAKKSKVGTHKMPGGHMMSDKEMTKMHGKKMGKKHGK